MNSYMNVWASMQNVCKRFIDMNPDLNFGEVIDFDESDGESLPQGNLTGIYQLDYTENDTLILAQCVFPVSIENDTGSLLLNDATGRMANFVRRDVQPFYNYSNGQIIGGMKPRNNLAVSPMVRTKSRKFKFVLQAFAFDRAATFVAP